MITRRQFRMGMTVTELKALIQDWPETDGTGEPTEVWIETAKNQSSPVTVVSPLNVYGNAADVLFRSAAFEPAEHKDDPLA